MNNHPREPQPVVDSPQERRGTIGNILALIAFAAIIAIGLWGLINAFRLLPDVFQNFFDRPPPIAELTISVPTENIRSGTPIFITWTHDIENGGFYSIAYPCRDAFELLMTETEEVIPCGNAFPLESGGERSVGVTPAFTQRGQIEVPISMLYTNEDGERTAADTGTLRVKGESVAVNPPTTPPATTPPPVAPVGSPDLQTRVLAIGSIDTASHVFTPKTVFQAHETVTVLFEVRNVGTARSGTWLFTAYLPTDPPHTYYPPRQQALGAGDWIEYTLSFDQLTIGSQTITITADPANEIRESNTHNNTVAQQITVY